MAEPVLPMPETNEAAPPKKRWLSPSARRGAKIGGIIAFAIGLLATTIVGYYVVAWALDLGDTSGAIEIGVSFVILAILMGVFFATKGMLIGGFLGWWFGPRAQPARVPVPPPEPPAPIPANAWKMPGGMALPGKGETETSR